MRSFASASVWSFTTLVIDAISRAVAVAECSLSMVESGEATFPSRSQPENAAPFHAPPSVSNSATVIFSLDGAVVIQAVPWRPV